ncbi:MAG: hypothetical protein KDE14_00590 [Rhodobacteraceae bacterium]|nr:hypothetical protein [Paracoccaceae bacterium]
MFSHAQISPLLAVLRDNATSALSVAALVIVAAAGWMSGQSETGDGAEIEARTSAFNLPAWSQPQLEEARAAALDQSLFEPNPDETAAQQAGSAKAPDDEDARSNSEWRFIGSVLNGDERWAFIVHGSPARLLSLLKSDPLPNGEHIEEISDDRLKYSDTTGEHTIKLFDGKTKTSKVAE